MHCIRCENGVWVCGEAANCDEVEENGGENGGETGDAESSELKLASSSSPPSKEWMEKNGWTHVVRERFVLGDYYAKCRPGKCNALIDTKEDVKPPWRVVGDLTLSAGSYALYCKTGKSKEKGKEDPCSVAVVPFF